MRIIDIDSKKETEVGVTLKRGENDIPCPSCSEDRRKKNLKPLRFNTDKGAGLCHHCGAKFMEVKSDFVQMEKIARKYQKPEWKNKTELSDKLVKYFEGRGISQNTLTAMKISEGEEWMPQDEKEVNTVQFNYFRDGELINIKFRTGDKHFKLFKDAELILYNLDAIKDSEECLICEGEIDCLSWMDAGYKYAVSVPNGAGQKTQNLQYLDNCLDYFANKKKIYISADNDSAGIALRDELVRRLGEERCLLVDLEGKKDANEYLCSWGNVMLMSRLNCAKEIPIEGVFAVEDFEPDLDALYEHGMMKGLTVGYGELDELVTWETKRLLTVTGIPGHGKSEFVDDLILRLNLIHGWKAAYFSPENYPLTLHSKKVIERAVGKRMNKVEMPIGEYGRAKQYVNENFRFIMPKDDEFSLDNILEKGRQLVRKLGIRILVIDPWNRLEYQQERGETETKYIARQLVKITSFAKRHDLLVILVAHPVKMSKTDTGEYEVPNLYNISGSANFFNMTDYGICVYRAESKVSVFVQKVKFKHLGTTGKADFRYNINNGRYLPETIVTEVVWDNTNWLNNRLNHLYTEPCTQSQIGYWEEVKDAGFDNMPAYNVPD